MHKLTSNHDIGQILPYIVTGGGNCVCYKGSLLPWASVSFFIHFFFLSLSFTHSLTSSVLSILFFFCRTFLCVSIFPKCAKEMVLSLRFQQLCVKHACLQWGLSLVLSTFHLSFYFSPRSNSLHYSHSGTSHSGVWQLWRLRSFENEQQGWCPEPSCKQAVDPEVTNVPCSYCCLPFGWYLGQYLQMESERAEQLILFLNKKWIKL